MPDLLLVEKTMLMFFVWMFVFFVTFFLTAYLIMVSYNNSIPEMSEQHKPIHFIPAMWFTLFICVISIYFKCNCGLSWKSLRQ
jgi:ABC-type sulfate transport system permease component